MLIKGGGLFTLGYLLPLQCFCFVCGTSENKSCSLMQCLVGSLVCVFSANGSFCRGKSKFTKANFQGFHQSLLSQFCINTHFQKLIFAQESNTKRQLRDTTASDCTTSDICVFSQCWCVFLWNQSTLFSLVFMTFWPCRCLEKFQSLLTENTLVWPGAKPAFQVNNLGLVCTNALMSFGTRGWSWLQLQQGSWIFTRTLSVLNQA